MKTDGADRAISYSVLLYVKSCHSSLSPCPIHNLKHALHPNYSAAKAKSQKKNLEFSEISNNINSTLVRSSLAQYLAQYELGVSRKQALTAKNILEKFFSNTGITDPEAITTASITCYLTTDGNRKLSAKTKRNHHAVISRYCGWLVSMGHMPENPAARVQLPSVRKEPAPYLDAKQRLRALRIAAEHDALVEVGLAMFTGLRVSEMRVLKWEDVHLEQRYLVVRRGKGGKSRTVPLCKATRRLLRRQQALTGQATYVWQSEVKPVPRCKHWWRYKIKPLQEQMPIFLQRKAGSVGRGWHLLRHTAASRWAMRNISLYKISNWMGHSHSLTTELYAHLQQGYDKDIER